MSEDPSVDVIGGSSRRGRGRHGKGKRHAKATLDDSSSSSVAQSFNDLVLLHHLKDLMMDKVVAVKVMIEHIVLLCDDR
ncbi:hypothetical protein SESBI_11707 [Sesbania bispinosa]|nr:hypothetical protein SESBI_11707 [Sesbania bispinosa]